MRIPKAPRNGSPHVRSPTALSTQERLLWRDVDGIVSSPNKEIAAQLYVQHVMSPLLGSEHVDAGVHFPSPFSHFWILELKLVIFHCKTFNMNNDKK